MHSCIYALERTCTHARTHSRTYVHMLSCAYALMHLCTMPRKRMCVAMIRAEAYALGMLMALHARSLAHAVPAMIRAQAYALGMLMAFHARLQRRELRTRSRCRGVSPPT